MDIPKLFYFRFQSCYHIAFSTEQLLIEMGYRIIDNYNDTDDIDNIERLIYTRFPDNKKQKSANISTLYIDIVPPWPKFCDLSEFINLDTVKIHVSIYQDLVNLIGFYNFRRNRISVGIVLNTSNEPYITTLDDIFPYNELKPYKEIGYTINTELLPIWSGQHTKSSNLHC